MALEKIKRNTLGQRLKWLLLGREKPNLLTRVSVITGFIIWIYLFTWQLLTLVSVLFIKYGTLPDSNLIRATYNNVGNKYGGDVINGLLIHSVIQIIIYLAILFSLILIWRKRKLGLLVYVIASLSTLLISFVLMGPRYMAYEIPLIDYILLGSTTLYFGIGVFIFYRKNKEELA